MLLSNLSSLARDESAFAPRPATLAANEPSVPRPASFRAPAALGYATRRSAAAFADARSGAAGPLAFTRAAWSMTVWLA